jgi:hypothetical protein
MGFRATATLAALYCNAHLPEGQKVTADDFVPGERGGVPPEIEELQWNRFTEQHGARDNG